MKRFLLLFFAFVLLVPGFACAMPVCGMSRGGHCPHHMSKATHGLMLMQDCAKAEFEKAPDVSYKAPDLGKAFSFAAAPVLPQSFDIADVRFIRGPPPDWPSLSGTHPPIILTTQRFRE
ncbi:MAG TPA: hypothetical protein VL625_12415 [Patescibacteria group bacterium]|nr:hypothetical protein [Patescibacteria group bacterium]